MAEKKILIVDYDSQSLNSISEMFKPHKFQILTAADGLSAYEIFKREKPDLVLLEAILPKLHGFDLTKKITQESKGSVPVIIVTGLYRGHSYRHEAMVTYGASDYFEKPFDKDLLLQSVLNLLKDKVDISLDLPDPNAVIQHLAQKVKGGPSGSKKTSR
jgi:DNA-binding response OmpR family regulator